MSKIVLLAVVSLVFFPLASIASPPATTCASASVLPGAAGASEPLFPDNPPVSCYDQCYWAYLTCPQDCRVSQQECYDATQVCYTSCGNGVGPWLPC